jgi:hypothetical protein
MFPSRLLACQSRGILVAALTVALMLLEAACMRIPLSCHARTGGMSGRASLAYDFSAAEHRYLKPLNTWVKNEPLEDSMLQDYRQGGIETLRTRDGLDCVPAETTQPCGDCYICHATVEGRADEDEMAPEWGGSCRRVGTLLIEIRIGPGPDTVRAVTYWQRPPVGSPAER